MSITSKQRTPPWLLFLFSLPAKRASQRVGVWRRLQRCGAVALRNSAYLLPNNPVNRERFEWLATSIRDQKGEASVAEVQAVDNLPDQKLARRFNEARARDYQALLVELRKFVGVANQGRPGSLNRLRSRLQEIVANDFFGCPLRRRVEELFERTGTDRSGAAGPESGKVDRREFVSRVWVTRARPGIDRCASAWLIRRSIDPRARFLFAPEGRAPHGAVPFDMFHGGFGHRGDDCTFETLQKVFRIRDRKVDRIAQIIHDADLCDEKFGRKEGFGIDEVLRGWARSGVPDKELLERGMQLIEGLYHSLS